MAPHAISRPTYPAGIGDFQLTECLARNVRFNNLVTDHAHGMNIDQRALAVRTLLHLPRVATRSGRITYPQIIHELRRAATELRDDARAVDHLVPVEKFSLDELIFARMSTAQSNELLSRLHYLRSARPGSFSFALLDPIERRPVTLCSVSPLQWRRVGSHVHALSGISLDRVWDVSRVYSSNVAPSNAISFLLSRVRNTLRRHGIDVGLLTTAVDRNLGFTGASYRAANWHQWMTVQPRPYLYHDRKYVSPRQLRQRFGTSSLTELQIRFPDQRFEQSRVRLLDSMIFCSRITGETEAIPAHQQMRLHR